MNSNTASTDATAFIKEHPVQETVNILDWQGNKRDYDFPTHFTNSSAITLIYTADYDKVSALLPRQVPKPVRVLNGKCLVMFTLFQYGNLSDNMQGYNEFVTGVIISQSRVPLLPAIFRKSFKSTGIFIFDMPVDAEENCHRGNVIWGLPKTMKHFNINRDAKKLYVKLTDQGELCYELSLPLKGRKWFTNKETNRSLSISEEGYTKTSYVYSHSNKQKYFTSLSPYADEVNIKFGTQAEHAQYNNIGLSKKPLIVRHCTDMSSALYAPKAY